MRKALHIRTKIALNAPSDYERAHIINACIIFGKQVCKCCTELRLFTKLYSFKRFDGLGENSSFCAENISECHIEFPVRASNRKAAG